MCRGNASTLDLILTELFNSNFISPSRNLNRRIARRDLQALKIVGTKVQVSSEKLVKDTMLWETWWLSSW